MTLDKFCSRWCLRLRFGAGVEVCTPEVTCYLLFGATHFDVQRLFLTLGILCMIFGSPFCFEQEPGEDGDARCSASLLWRWLGRCLEGEAVPDVVLLQEDRMRLFATLSDKTMGEVEALHLTRATLDSRAVDATLPLLATFEEFAETLPRKAALDAIDLLQLPGFLHVCLESGNIRCDIRW